MSYRADALAFRLETGAAMLGELAEQLTEAEWNTKVRDGRTVGVIVHHVASMYPIEMDAARTIASGKPFVGVTWEVIAEVNANHARENKNATKAEALALLRRNSQEAAAAIRRFTDDELDTAAPFSLSFDAPMTAQFVIEDHALRHSFHHLARIKDVLPKLQAVAV
jgi:hypothetical protein